MIVKGFELRRKAYMVSAPKAATVTTLESGQLLALNAAGEAIICDGSTRGFISFSDMNTEKDNVKDHGNVVSMALGACAVTVDAGSFVTGQSYAFGTRLMSDANGKFTPITEGTTSEALICAVAMGTASNNTLRILQVG